MRKMLSRKQTIDLVNEAIESGEIHADPSTEVKVGDINSESATAGKVIVADGEGGAEWGDIPNELPSISGNADKVLKVNSGATGVEWGEVSGGGGTQLYKHSITIDSSVAFQSFTLISLYPNAISTSAGMGTSFNIISGIGGGYGPGMNAITGICYEASVVFDSGETKIEFKMIQQSDSSFVSFKCVGSAITDTVTAL